MVRLFFRLVARVSQRHAAQNDPDNSPLAAPTESVLLQFLHVLEAEGRQQRHKGVHPYRTVRTSISNNTI